MRLVHKPHRGTSKLQLFAELACFGDGSIEVRLIEGIGEAQLELVEHVGAGMERHRTTDRLRHGAKLVDAVAMVAMGVRDDDSVEPSHSRREQLLPKIGPAIDQHALAAALDQD